MKNCNIGGQALIEGILMRNENDYAISVRRSNQEIITKKDIVKSNKIKDILKKIPIVRGVVNFLSSIALGYEALSYSASMYEEDIKEEEKNEQEIKQEEIKQEEIKKEEIKQEEIKKEEIKRRKQKTSKKENKDSASVHSIMMAFTMVVSLALSISLFIILPYFLANILTAFGVSDFMTAIAEGLIRIAIFFGYMIFISMMKDIKRVLMYHGAEHKCINCIENELPLTVENVMKSSRFHKRCGPGFLFYIVIVSILLFMFIKVDFVVLRVLIRLFLVPVIAGIAYEFLKLTGKKDNAFVRIISSPALFFQRFTTKEPTFDMVEVAISAVNAVYPANEEKNAPV